MTRDAYLTGAAVVVDDNRDLMVRRKRVGLTAQDVAAELGLPDMNAIYHFEAGTRRLPHGKTRRDVERLLARHEKKQRRAS